MNSHTRLNLKVISVRPEGCIAPAGTDFRFFKTERMYRNFASQGNPAYTGSISGSNSVTLGSTSTSTTQQEQVGVLSFSQVYNRLSQEVSDQIGKKQSVNLAVKVEICEFQATIK